MKRTIWILLGLLLVYLLFWPVPFPVFSWDPPPAPTLESGPYATNNYLAGAEIYATLPHGEGPEDIAVDSNGLVYGGLINGKILRYQPDGSDPVVFAETGGRPLGLHFDRAMNLIVADARKGLLSINPEGEITVLSEGLEAYQFMFADDLDIAADGKIYFSDASTIASVGNYRDDIMSHCPCGKLLVYDPASKQTNLLLDSLHFANGIAISPDQSFVLINETTRYRVLKYWLQGSKKGSWEVLIDNLPGFPDGISTGENGLFWIALTNPRNALLDKLLPYPFLRKMVPRLPQFVQPQPVRHALVLGINAEGQLLYNLQNHNGDIAHVASVQEANGKLYLGSLTDPVWGRIAIPD